MPHPDWATTDSDVMLVLCRMCGAFSGEIVCDRCKGLRIEALRWLRDISEVPAEYAEQDGVVRLPNPE